MSIFVVTGCAGFIGSHLTEELLEQGHQVLGIDSLSDYYEVALKERNLDVLRAHSGFRYLRSDLLEVEASQFEGVDGIFHLAAQAGVRSSWGQTFDQYLRDNLGATQRVFEAANSVRVVFASSSSIYGDALGFPTRETGAKRPISPYGVTKSACEELAYAYEKGNNLDWVGLRYFTVYGPRQRTDMAFTRIARALLTGEAFQLSGDGSQRRDFTFVLDAVKATTLVMAKGHRGEIYNVGGGHEASLRGAIQEFEAVSGRQLDIRYGPSAVGDAVRTVADTRRIRRRTGWKPEVPLREGVAAQWQWATDVWG